MCERRVLILAAVTNIHDSAVTYPSCCRCYSKLLVDPTTGRYHCIRCGVSCDRSKVQWRYRLVLSVADGTTIGRVVVFGRTLDGFFGKTATDFSRSLDDLEQTGYPASSMLSEALLGTFHGKYFYFGFKLTSCSDAEETPALKDVLKSENSLCYSQLDCTANFENSHTLAYQMLACSDAVYATVTDHMRLFVKHLRNPNQSKTLKTPDSNQSWKVSKETQSVKNVSSRTVGSLSSCKTVSFGADQESLRFSFETDENQSVSNHEIEKLSRSKNSVSKNQQYITEWSEHDKSLFAPQEEDLKNKEIFLAGSEVKHDDLPGCVSSNTVNENEDSFFPLIVNGSKAYSILQSKNKKFDKVCSSSSFVASSNADSFSTLDGILLAHRLDFDNLDESTASNTSNKIDNELKRRKFVSLSQKNVFDKTASSYSHVRVPDKESCLDEIQLKTKCENAFAPDEHLTDITVETDHADAIKSKNKLNNCENTNDKTVDSGLLRKQDCNVIDELQMPESEDLDAFFGSQFEGIEFTQEVASAESSTKEEDRDILGISNIRTVSMNSKDIEAKNLDLNTSDIKEKEIDLDRLTNKQFPVMTRVEGINSIKKTKTDFPYLPESEQIDDFLDSFEDCLLQEEELLAQGVAKVNIYAKSKHSDKIGVEEKKSTVGKCTDIDKELNDVKGLTDENAFSLGNMDEDYKKVDSEVVPVGKETAANELKYEKVDDFLIDKEADLHEEEEFFSTLSFVKIDNDGVKSDSNGRRYGLEHIECGDVSEFGFVFNDSVNCNEGIELQKESSVMLVKDNDTGSINSSLDKAIEEVNKIGNEEHELIETDSSVEKMSDDVDSESSDLEQFFANISNNERQIPEVVDEMLKSDGSCVMNEHANEFTEENKVEKRQTNNVIEELVDINEDMESDFDELLHDFSEASFKESEKDSYIVNLEDGENVNSEKGHKVSSSVSAESKIETVSPVGLESETSEIEANCSVIDKSSDFEATKVKISKIKPMFRLLPFSSLLRVGHKSQRMVQTAAEIKNVSAKSEHTKSDTTNESYSKETMIPYNGMDACNSGSTEKLKNPVGNSETPTEKRECEDTKNESSPINYSVDLFEMSGGEIEHSSAYVLTVCTPSFNSNLDPENASVNEGVFKDSPLGTSTPGLDECVIFDSQFMSGINDSQSENNLVDQGEAKRKVKFDKRLRRVSSCHVMDIRMRLNESPLNMPVVTVKSCLKAKSHKSSLKNVAENSVVQESTNNSPNLEANAEFEKAISENLSGYIEEGSSSNGSSTKQSSVCLDGSSDLFGGSFIISAKEPIALTVDKRENDKPNTRDNEIRRKYDVKENGKGEEVKAMTTFMPNSQDLWLNESTDSFMYDAMADCKQSPDDKLETSGEENALKVIRAYSETPDIFVSQENYTNVPAGKNVIENNCSENCKFPENQINGDVCIRKIGETNRRKVLKCLVTNTPDSDTASYSKPTGVSLKFHKHSSQIGEYSGNEQNLNEMKENVGVDDSPDIFGDSLNELDRKLICDKKNAFVNKTNILCKKLFF